MFLDGRTFGKQNFPMRNLRHLISNGRRGGGSGIGRRLAGAMALPILLLCAAAGAGENWAQWRGPNFNGSTDARNLPLHWSETKNIAWKVPLPAWSAATPIVYGDRIFVVSPTASVSANPTEIKMRRGGQAYNGGKVYSLGFADPGGEVINLHCLNRRDGSTVWIRELGAGNRKRMKHNMASVSPVTDGRFVWAMTGRGALRAFDFEGNEIWARDLPAEYGPLAHVHGFASTPLLYQDRLIIAVLHGAKTDQSAYLLALEKTTGREIWRTERPTDAVGESPDSYATPLLLSGAGGDEVIVNGGDIVTAHDPISGAELWRCGGLNPKKQPTHRLIASCVIGGDVVFVPKRLRTMIAVRAGGRGDVTSTRLMWKLDYSGPDVSTPTTDGRLLWMLNDNGVFRCLDLETGRALYEPQRLTTGSYSPSPLLADGRVYALSEDATMTVLSATDRFEILAVNKLDDAYTLSSPVAAGRQIFIRTSRALYCIAEGGDRD